MTGPATLAPRRDARDGLPWAARAACAHPATRDDLPVEAWFPDERIPAEQLLGRLRAVCGACPVQRECLTHALAAPERHGVWAGTTGADRERRRRDARVGAAS